MWNAYSLRCANLRLAFSQIQKHYLSIIIIDITFIKIHSLKFTYQNTNLSHCNWHKSNSCIKILKTRDNLLQIFFSWKFTKFQQSESLIVSLNFYTFTRLANVNLHVDENISFTVRKGSTQFLWIWNRGQIGWIFYIILIWCFDSLNKSFNGHQAKKSQNIKLISFYTFFSV